MTSSLEYRERARTHVDSGRARLVRLDTPSNDRGPRFNDVRVSEKAARKKLHLSLIKVLKTHFGLPDLPYRLRRPCPFKHGGITKFHAHKPILDGFLYFTRQSTAL